MRRRRRRSPAEFPSAPLTAPRVEAEIVVELAAELGPGAGLDAIADAISWAALAFEFVDCHYEDWALKPPDLVADFCAHAGLVIGPPAQLPRAELLNLDTFPVELRSDGSTACDGSGERVAGGPLRAIAAVLAAPHAPTVPAGALIMTGALTGGAHPAEVGQDWLLAPGRSDVRPGVGTDPVMPVLLGASAHSRLAALRSSRKVGADMAPLGPPDPSDADLGDPNRRVADAVAQQWPLAGRREELREMSRLFDVGGRGLILAGPAGVGKTRLALELLARVEATGGRTVRVIGTRAAAGIPLGAFASVLPPPSRGAEAPASTTAPITSVCARSTS